MSSVSHCYLKWKLILNRNKEVPFPGMQWEDTLGNLTHDDCDVEFGMEYDGKVYLESISVQEDGLIQAVMSEINNKFKLK